MPAMLDLVLRAVESPAAQNPANVSAPVGKVGWASDRSYHRGTIDLLYSCLFTGFLCTWSVLHLELPADNHRRLRRFFRKVRYMALGILAPEIVAYLALIQRFNVRQLQNKPVYPSALHAFVELMGGYSIDVIDDKESPSSYTVFRLGKGQAARLVELHLAAFPPEEDILDKSKSDWISKSVTLVQIVWFVCQVIGRAVECLPITTLEIFTCGIIICSVIAYLSWWQKPKDIDRPVRLKGLISQTQLRENRINKFSYRNGLSADEDSEELFTKVAAVVPSLLFGACHIAAWNFTFPTAAEQTLWKIASVACAVLAVSLIFANHTDITGSIPLSMIFLLLLCAYIIVRLYLLIEAFIGLRSVPADVYQAATWPEYIPHI